MNYSDVDSCDVAVQVSGIKHNLHNHPAVSVAEYRLIITLHKVTDSSA